MYQILLPAHPQSKRDPVCWDTSCRCRKSPDNKSIFSASEHVLPSIWASRPLKVVDSSSMFNYQYKVFYTHLAAKTCHSWGDGTWCRRRTRVSTWAPRSGPRGCRGCAAAGRSTSRSGPGCSTSQPRSSRAGTWSTRRAPPWRVGTASAPCPRWVPAGHPASWFI